MKGISGIDTARMLRRRDKKVKIVYVTAYEDFRDYAFSVHAFGYLVKPVKRESVHEMIREVLDYTEEETDGPRLKFQTEEGIIELKIQEIIYFEYLQRKIRIVSEKGTFHMKGSIGVLGERLAAMGFAVPHKSFVVNLGQVKHLKGYEIWMTDGSTVPLSQKKSANFRQQLTGWLAQQL